MDVGESLCFLINSLGGGGTEKIVLRLAESLKPTKVYLLEKDIDYPVKRESLSFLSMHKNNTNPLLKNLSIPIYAFRLAKRLNEKNIVISFLERANFTNIIARCISKHRAVISVRMNQLTGHHGIRTFNKFLARILYPRADLIVAVSKGVKESLIKLGLPEDKIRVIYNPYPLDEIGNKAKEKIEDFFGESSYLITAGRLTKEKGQWHLLRIFRGLKNSYPELKLLILGEGGLKDYLIELSESLGFKTFVWDRDKLGEDFDVYFLGFQKNPYKYIFRAKLFIFTSLWEGFPNSLLEAMACGVVVVSSDCRSGPREILAPETDFRYQTKEPEFAEYGVLMPVLERSFLDAYKPLTEREKKWIEIIENILGDEELRKIYLKKAKQRISDFRVEEIVRIWRKVLDEI